MKINNSTQTTKTQETQESQNAAKGPKGGGTSPRAGNATADSVEMISTAKSKAETSGQRQLTADEQAMAGKIDPKNYTSLHSGTDPRAALESKPFDKYKQPSPRGTSTMPNGQTPSGPDLSKYTTPTNGAPPSLKESMDQIGSRGEKLKGLVGNATDMFNDPLKFKGNNSQGGPGSLGKSMISDEQTPMAKTIEKVDKGSQGVVTAIGGVATIVTATAGAVAAAPIVAITAGAVAVMAGLRAADDATGIGDEIVNGFVKADEHDTVQEKLAEQEFEKAKAKHEADEKKKGGGVKDPGPDVDGTAGSGGRGGSLVDSLFNGGTILQGVTGKGPGGGEVINPSDETTGGGKGPFDDHGAYEARRTQDNADYLIGQPAQRDEDGFNGLSGTGGGQRGGNIDNEDGSGYEGGQRTEEPGEIKLTPGGDGQLSHLIKK
jgi:hypothetical protein